MFSCLNPSSLSTIQRFLEYTRIGAIWEDAGRWSKSSGEVSKINNDVTSISVVVVGDHRAKSRQHVLLAKVLLEFPLDSVETSRVLQIGIPHLYVGTGKGQLRILSCISGVHRWSEYAV